MNRRQYLNLHVRFGSHLVECSATAAFVDDAGEAHVSRVLCVFSVGQANNPATLLSQLIGGTTLGLSIALLKERPRHRFRHFVTQDFVHYQIGNDIYDIDAVRLDDADEHANPLGSRGPGQIGIVSAAAAVVNAIQHATGIRIRVLPVLYSTPQGFPGKHPGTPQT